MRAIDLNDLELNNWLPKANRVTYTFFAFLDIYKGTWGVGDQM
jgi:hypothetical protein